MTLPTIHLNGSSILNLIADNDRALRSVRDTINALAGAAPNGRDYYVQGPVAWPTALAEHEERMGLLKVIERDLMAMQEYLYGQQDLQAR